jgi:muramoyltetrapeptide carboxypeptidase
MIKAKTLKEGDTIGIVSPSSPMAARVKHRAEKGIKMLEEMGFNVRIGKNALNVSDHTAGTPEERAEDLNDFFRDDSVNGIISFIGGFHSNQVLKHLDLDAIRNHPKVFMGYSDITVLHMAIYTKADLVTFYGPAVLTQLAENPRMLPYTEEHFRKAVMSGLPIGKASPSLEWTDEVLNWFEKKDLERPRQMKRSLGWQWLREGSGEGEILGGCITSLLHLRGTPYWPDFNGKIFFWELSESSGDFTKGEPASRIDAHLTDLELSGVFDNLKGMIIGRPFGYSQEYTEKLKEIVLQRTRQYKFPILFGIDIGHTDPIMTIPLGVKTFIDSNEDRFEILESATID